MTLEAFLVQRWLPIKLSAVAVTTGLSYNNHVKRHIVPNLGYLRLTDVNTEILNSFYLELREGRRHGTKPLAPKSVKNIHGTLRMALEYAISLGLVAANPAEKVELPSATNREMTILEPHEVKAFFNFARGKPYDNFFRIAALTGLRRSEVAGLKWIDINFDQRRARIQRAVVSAPYKPKIKEGKTENAPRSVPLSGAAIETLTAQYDETGVLADGWVFTSTNGGLVNPSLATSAFERRIKASGVRVVRLHDLRHSWATHALASGVPIKVVSEILGHSSPAFTMKIYAHATPSMLEKAADIIGELYEL